MDNRKHEALRALEALEGYYHQLDPVSHAELKQAINRLIQVFKSRLFQALVDIQTLYESTLMNSRADIYQKKRAIDNLAEEIETRAMFNRNRLNDENTNDQYARIGTLVTDNPIAHSSDQPKTIDEADDRRAASLDRIESRRSLPPIPSSLSPTTVKSDQFISGKIRSEDFTPNERYYKNHWEVVDVRLERTSDQPLGFSVAGGCDSRCIKDSDVILISKIAEGGLAEKSKLVKLHDIILKVNNVDFTHIEHKRAIDTLKTSGKNVHLVIRRLSPPSVEEVRIVRPPDTNLGLSVHGGITHPVYKDDPGMFVNKIVPGGLVDQNGSISIGDRLISIQSERKLYDLEYMEHKQAVECIRRACNESASITLTVAHIYIPEDEIENSLPETRQSQPPSTNQKLKIDKDEVDDTISVGEKNSAHIPSGQRSVIINRTEKGFGFNFINHQGRTFITHIIAGGAAEKTRELYRGDEIISVNDTSFHGLNNDDVIGTIKNCGDQISMIVIHNYDDYTWTTNALLSQPVIRPNRSTSDQNRVKSLSKHQFYVKAKIDYDPKKDMTTSGSKPLAFRAGDMLYVTNSADDNWWQARRLTPDFRDTNDYGIIPSSTRFEKKERARRRRVNFDRAETDKKSGLSADKKISNSRSSKSTIDKSDFQSTEDSENDMNDSISPYEHISMSFVEYYSPVVILGPLNEEIGRRLIKRDRHKFSRPIYETSRPKRNDEVEGDMYRFLTRDRMQADIADGCYLEYGESKNNFYGLRLDEVRNLVQNSKHCVLTFKRGSIEHLMRENLKPIVISINAPNVDWIFKNMTEGEKQENAQKMFDEALDATNSYKDLITANVSGNNLEEVVDRIIAVIDNLRKKSALTTSIENLEK